MDVSAARAVETIALDAIHAGKHLYLCGINEVVAASLAGLGVNEHLSDEHRYASRLEALQAARNWIFDNMDDNASSADSTTDKPTTA
jgi:SulP family sulfate permease